MKVATAGTGSLVLLHLELLATGCTSSVMHRAASGSFFSQARTLSD